MKFRIIYYLLIISLYSCNGFFGDDFDLEGYRDGSLSNIQINDGSLIGNWEETYNWKVDDIDGEHPSAKWSPININNSDNYVFLVDGTFTSTNNILDCLGSNGNYLIEGTKITLTYICETQPEITKEVIINEFFFTENFIVFIQEHEDGTETISRMEFIE
jgi:hypothetical protein